MTLSFDDARSAVLRQQYRRPGEERVPLAEAFGRVLAQTVSADRDYPPLDRSVRDGFAVRSADLPGPIPVSQLIRAGDPRAVLQPGTAAEIMTGAPIPQGADAVLMIEHAKRDGDFITHAPVEPGTFISRQGEEASNGQVLIETGTRLDASHVAILATCGHPIVSVFRKPTVSILATGDELIPIDQTPAPYQIRNSNAHALAAQVIKAGGIPKILGVARDDRDDTRAHIKQGLAADLLLLSGGVSAGKFDFVEDALASLGAVFHFDRVKIQPGAPVVFGECRDCPFFGLPGNPVSTLVTFELFARAALDLLGGREASPLPVTYGRLTEGFRHKSGLTRILPALIDGSGSLTPVHWHGSSDMPAVARANAFLIANADQEQWAAGDFLPLLWK